MKLSPSDIRDIEAALDKTGHEDGGAAVKEALEVHQAFIDGLKDDLAASRADQPVSAADVHAEARDRLERRIYDHGEG